MGRGLHRRLHKPPARLPERRIANAPNVQLTTAGVRLSHHLRAYAIASHAGQIFRGITNSDHGIDGELEFKDDQGRASGQRLYLQLKSGDSYPSHRQRDNAEVFQIKNPRWSSYWQQQAYHVMLVIRTSDGVIRWMDVSDYLRRESRKGKPLTQIVFQGEHLDAMSVRRMRERALAGGDG